MALGLTVTAQAQGLILTPNDIGEIPPGALVQADNIVLTRESVIESRRGLYVFATVDAQITMLKRLLTYQDRLLAWGPDNGGAVELWYSNAGFSAFSQYTGLFAQPTDGIIHAAEANRNLYITHGEGVKRLDVVTGTPVAAGAPVGLDVEAAIVSGAAGTALHGDARFAYRVLWGIRDANNNLILGAPSARYVVTSPACTVGGGSLARAGTTVTATVAAHGFKVNDQVQIYPGEANFPAGTKTITGITGTTFTYTEAGTATSSSRSHRFQLIDCDAVLEVTIPPDATTSHFLQVYRSPGSETADLEPDDQMGLVYEANPPETLTISTRTRTGGNSVEATTASNHGLATGSLVYISPSIADYAAGLFEVTVTAANKFTYVQAGANNTSAAAQTEKPVTLVFTDSLPESLLGAALYTNDTQEGILQANVAPPAARDVCEFKGSLVLGDCDHPPRVIATLLAIGAPAGLQGGDAFTLGGTLTFTAGVSEDPSTGAFKLFTDGTPTQNVQNTVASIARVINRRQDNTTHIAYAITGTEDEPGRIIFQRRTYSGNVDFAPGVRKTAWNPPRNTTGASERYKNAVYWSKRYQPDAVPFLNYARLGSADKRVLRIVPTRDSVFILKEDGVWRLSGDSPSSFRIDVLDTTLRCVAPESAVTLDGTCWALTEQGVVRITESGVMVVSRGIEPLLWPLLAQAIRPTVKDIAFAVGYESDRKYMLWLPSAAGQTNNTQAFVYDLYTDSWTRRNDTYRCGIVNPVDDTLYTGSGNGVYKERKAFQGDDDYIDGALAVTINTVGATSLTLADASAVQVGDGIGQGVDSLHPSTYAIVTAKNGNVCTVDRSTAGFSAAAAVLYVGIGLNIKWSPKFAQNPAALHRMREVHLTYRSVYFAKATVYYSTNISPAEEAVSCIGADLGFANGASAPQFTLRTLVPLEKSRASQMNVRYSHRQARTNPQIQVLTLGVNPASLVRTGM